MFNIILRIWLFYILVIPKQIYVSEPLEIYVLCPNILISSKLGGAIIWCCTPMWNYDSMLQFPGHQNNQRTDNKWCHQWLYSWQWCVVVLISVTVVIVGQIRTTKGEKEVLNFMQNNIVLGSCSGKNRLKYFLWLSS